MEGYPGFLSGEIRNVHSCLLEKHMLSRARLLGAACGPREEGRPALRWEKPSCDCRTRSGGDGRGREHWTKAGGHIWGMAGTWERGPEEEGPRGRET